MVKSKAKKGLINILITNQRFVLRAKRDSIQKENKKFIKKTIDKTIASFEIFPRNIPKKIPETIKTVEQIPVRNKYFVLSRA
nr:hypothetical protein [Oenococcus oeni]